MGLKPGTRVPDFRLPDQDGNLFDSSDMVGKKPLVIFFYPRDYTPGCTKEVCAFRDHYEDFLEFGAEVIGISSDPEKRHYKFSRSYQLPFPLLSDRDGKVRKLFKVKGNFFNLLPGRETFVIDRSGKVCMAFNSMDPAWHLARALKAVENQQIS